MHFALESVFFYDFYFIQNLFSITPYVYVVRNPFGTPENAYFSKFRWKVLKLFGGNGCLWSYNDEKYGSF